MVVFRRPAPWAITASGFATRPAHILTESMSVK